MDFSEFKSLLAKCRVSMRQVLGLRAELDSIIVGGGGVPNTRTVNGHALSSDVTVTATDVGLGNCDNTSDANKPISTATQSALDAKQGSLGFTAVPNTRTVNGLALSGDIIIPQAAFYCNTLSAVSGNIAGYTVRLATGPLMASGTQLRVKIQPPASGTCHVDHLSVVERSGVTANGTTTPVELLFAAAAGFTLAAGSAALWSDWLTYTTDDTKDYLIIWDLHGSGTIVEADNPGSTGDSMQRYYKAGATSYGVQNMPGGNTADTRASLIAEIQVK